MTRRRQQLRPNRHSIQTSLSLYWPQFLPSKRVRSVQCLMQPREAMTREIWTVIRKKNRWPQRRRRTEGKRRGNNTGWVRTTPRRLLACSGLWDNAVMATSVHISTGSSQVRLNDLLAALMPQLPRPKKIVEETSKPQNLTRRSDSSWLGFLPRPP